MTMQMARLEPGRVYHNRCGSDYFCRGTRENGNAEMQRTSDGWTLVAHGVRMYPDGTIEWDYSTGGHWPQKI